MNFQNAMNPLLVTSMGILLFALGSYTTAIIM